MSDLTQRIAQLSPEQRIRLEERLLAAHKNGNSQRIPRRADTGPVPLSFTQERLWFLAQLEPDSSAYNEATVIRLRGPLDVLALERSLDALSERHDSLRVCFREIDDSVMQVAEPLPSTRIDIFDFTSVLEGAQMEAVWQKVDSARSVIFDLTAPPLWRVFLIRLADDDHIFVRITHHIISDGWSSSIFWRELRHFYAAFVDGKAPAPLPDLPVSYADFSVWQRQHLQGERLTNLVDYWRERLAGIEPLNLPTDHPRPAQPSHRGALLEFKLDGELSDSLSALARESGASLYMLLLAAFQTLLHRYSGQDDIVVGSPIANRSRPELEGIYGFFANTLVLRADCGGNPTFRSLLAQARQNALSAYQHQDLPYEKLVEELHPVRDMSRSPIVDVLFALQNVPRSALGLAGTVMHRLDKTASTSKFDLSLFLQERDGDLDGRVEYATDLFDAATIQRLVGHFRTLLQGVVADPDSPIGELPLLTEPERSQILVEWNDTVVGLPERKCVHQLFEEQVARTPNAIAIETGTTSLTYVELNRWSNQVAQLLQNHGVQPNDLIGVVVEQDISTLVALLAILKAGGAYVPFDPRQPAARLSRMLSAIDPKILLVSNKIALASLAEDLGVIPTEIPPFAPNVESDTDLMPTANLGDTAYAFFTSGSTGMPKAVLLPHRTLMNLIDWQLCHPRLGRSARTLQLSSLSFDVSLQEILSTWTNGGTLVVPPSELQREPLELVRFIEKEQIERLFLPYVLLQAIADCATEQNTILSSLQDIISAGETLHLTHAIRSMMQRLPECRLHNHYGPTETHVVTAEMLVGSIETWPSDAPIGKPISNTHIFLLDSHRQPVPIGIPGELYIGGAGLALGYLNRPDLTAERFVPHPFSDDPDARLYRSGDLARYREDGVIEFLGRADRQVKIRGFRVEPGEIEAVLRDHPAVREGVAGVLDDEKLGKRLVVWWMGKPGATASVDELRNFLHQRLPDYMLPAAFIQVDALPLTPNGKVDIRALPDPANHHQPGHLSKRQAESALEQQLLRIWESVLGQRGIGVEDNFFDLGGHSLLAVRLMAKVATITGRELPVASLFQGPTVRQQALLLADEGWTPPWVSLVPVQPGGSRPPLFLVPPAASTGLRFAYLTRFLGPDQPIYGFDPGGLDDRSQLHTTVEEMAAHFVSELRRLQPKGPYLVGGMCFGGHVAYEMAQQLGEDVPEVILLDVGQPANGPTWSLPPRNFLYDLRRFLEYRREGHHWSAARVQLYSRWKKYWRRIRHWYDPDLQRMGRVYGMQLPAMRNYVASPTHAKLILFQSDEPMVNSRQHGWQKLSDRFEIIHFPNTTHRSLLLEDENVERIADKLREVVDRWMAEHWQDVSR